VTPFPILGYAFELGLPRVLATGGNHGQRRGNEAAKGVGEGTMADLHSDDSERNIRLSQDNYASPTSPGARAAARALYEHV
jgi:hypothetical protein